MTKDNLIPKIIEVYERLAKGALLPTDLIEVPLAAAESNPSWIERAHRKNQMVELDALVFRHFRAPMGAILDVGAHWGYMALSIRNSGTDCPIVSFEALSAHKASLQRLKELDTVGYDYRIVGVSDRTKVVTLFGPVVNGRPITALSSVDGSVFDRRHAEYIGSLLGQSLPVSDAYEFKLLKTVITCESLDDLLADPDLMPRARKIAALKIDVEGHEAQVLAGAEGMIQRDLPFVMNEGANRSAALVAFMHRHGYRAAERRGNKITEIFNESKAVNGYWFHESKRGDYESIGLIQNDRPVARAFRRIRSEINSVFMNNSSKRDVP